MSTGSSINSNKRIAAAVMLTQNRSAKGRTAFNDHPWLSAVAQNSFRGIRISVAMISQHRSSALFVWLGLRQANCGDLSSAMTIWPNSWAHENLCLPLESPCLTKTTEPALSKRYSRPAASRRRSMIFFTPQCAPTRSRSIPSFTQPEVLMLSARLLRSHLFMSHAFFLRSAMVRVFGNSRNLWGTIYCGTSQYHYNN